MPVYVLDSSIWIRIGRNHPPDIFVKFWEQLDASIANREILSPEEVLYELERGTDDLGPLLRGKQGLFVPLDEALMVAVSAVMVSCPDLADLDAERNRADPFVVALARIRQGTVATEERPRRGRTGRPRIPDACTQLGVQYMDWFGFLRAIGWRL